MAKHLQYSPEQIITKMREAEVYLSQGKIVGQAYLNAEKLERCYA